MNIPVTGGTSELALNSDSQSKSESTGDAACPFLICCRSVCRATSSWSAVQSHESNKRNEVINLQYAVIRSTQENRKWLPDRKL